MDPYREGRKEAKRQAALLKQRLGRNIELNEFELVREGGVTVLAVCVTQVTVSAAAAAVVVCACMPAHAEGSRQGAHTDRTVFVQV